MKPEVIFKGFNIFGGLIPKQTVEKEYSKSSHLIRNQYNYPMEENHQ